MPFIYNQHKIKNLADMRSKVIGNNQKHDLYTAYCLDCWLEYIHNAADQPKEFQYIVITKAVYKLPQI